MENSAADRGCTAGEKRQCYDWGYRDGANDMKNEIMATKATKADEAKAKRAMAVMNGKSCYQ